jgi:hypothetical protein
VAASPENNRTLHVGYFDLSRIANSMPVNSGIITSEIKSVGGWDSADRKASRGLVNAKAEKPEFLKIAPSVKAIICSSSTT